MVAQLGDPAVEMLLQLMRTQVFAERGEIARAEAAVTRWRVIAEELGQQTQTWLASYQAAAKVAECVPTPTHRDTGR